MIDAQFLARFTTFLKDIMEAVRHRREGYGKSLASVVTSTSYFAPRMSQLSRLHCIHQLYYE